jgi:Ca2+-binding EF-hand superfamily protein
MVKGEQRTMSKSLYLVTWTHLTDITSEEADFIREHFDESDSDHSLLIEEDNFNDVLKNLTKADKEKFANLLAIIKDKLAENQGDMSIAIG